MRIDDISKIKIIKLRPTKDGFGLDRRGPMIEVYPKGGVEVTEYYAQRIVSTLQSVISLLGYSIDHVKRGETGEQMECWINVELHDKFVWVNHKYWSQAQVDCFHDLMLTLAKLHNWEWEIKKEEPK